MTKAEKAKTTQPTVVAVVADDPARNTGRFRAIGGSKSDDWNNLLMNSAMQTMWFKSDDEATSQKRCSALVAGLIGIGPKDEIEGMLGAQLMACHLASMECFRRAMIPEQTFDGRRENLNHGNKSSRTFATLLETLNKHRGKVQQKVTVEHVHVHAGGQAIVGTVTRGGGSTATSEDQSLEPKPLPVPNGTALPCKITAHAQPVPQRRDEG